MLHITCFDTTVVHEQFHHLNFYLFGNVLLIFLFVLLHVKKYLHVIQLILCILELLSHASSMFVCVCVYVYSILS